MQHDHLHRPLPSPTVPYRLLPSPAVPTVFSTGTGIARLCRRDGLGVSVDRIGHLFRDIDAVLEREADGRAPKGLRVERVLLVSLLRYAIADLHDLRRRVADTSAAKDVDRSIEYWEVVLNWLRDQTSEYADIMSPV